MIAGSISVRTRYQRIGSGAAPQHDWPFTTQQVLGSRLLEQTIARMEWEFGHSRSGLARLIEGGIGHNLPHEAPKACGQAVLDAAGRLKEVRAKGEQEPCLGARP
jgi:hypothetical protein